MKLSTIITALLVFLFSNSASAQDWVKEMKEGKSFFEVQEAFNQQWATKEYEKGKGYKQYKRWEYYMQPRVDADGFLPPASHIWSEYEELTKSKTPGNPNKNGNWTFKGPVNINPNGNGAGIGRVNVFAIHPTNSEIMYVGTPGGGLWKSTNGGDSWSPMTDHLPAIGVSGIILRADDPNTIYMGTGDGDGEDTFSFGILKSTDAGETWEPTGLSFETIQQRNVHTMIAHPTNPDIMFAATTTGLYKTTDGWETFVNVASGDVLDVEFHPTNPEIVYACRPSFLRSDNGGNSFTQTTVGLPHGTNISGSRIAVSADEPDWVYMVAGGTDYGLLGVYRSTDVGQSFEERANQWPNLLGWSSSGTDEGGQAWYDLAITADPLNANRVTLGGVNVWQSTNAGTNWSLKAHWVTGNSGYVHADIHYLGYHNNILFCGSDGGIFASSSQGNNWVDISSDLEITQIYKIGTTDQDPNLVTLGAQDNGTTISSGSNWFKIFGGDGMETEISPSNTNRIYVSTQNGNLYASSNGGNNFDNLSWSINESGGWVTPYEVKPSNNNRIIAGFENVWEYNGFNWNQLSDFHNFTIQQLAVAPSNDDYIYFSRGHRVFMTSNFGEDWDEVYTGFTDLEVSGIDVHPTNPEVVYITLSGYSDGNKVEMSTDGGENWQNVSYNLPNVPANCVELAADGGVYVGTDLGVFYTGDDLSNWQHYSDGMPFIEVTDLDLLPNSNIIRAATYGRGIWDSPLYTPIASAPVTDFSATPLSICPGESVTFTDESFNGNPDWQWTFEGGEPATANEANPVVTYSTPGAYEVSLTMTNAFGEDTETKTSYIIVAGGETVILPFLDDFESYSDFPQEEWFVGNEENNVTWELNTEVGYSGTNSMMLDNNQGNEDDIDYLVSRPLDLTNVSDAQLTYRYAHAQRNEDNTGKMRLYFSSNCGNTWQVKEVLSASNDLATAEPTEEFFVPTDDEWVQETENIGEQYYVSDFRFRFKYENDNGNAVYLDDINIETSVGILSVQFDDSGIQVYPNPADDFIQLNFDQEGRAQLVLTDALGAVVLNKSLNKINGTQDLRLEVSDLTNGLYNLEIRDDNGTRITKVMIER